MSIEPSKYGSQFFPFPTPEKKRKNESNKPKNYIPRQSTYPNLNPDRGTTLFYGNVGQSLNQKTANVRGQSMSRSIRAKRVLDFIDPSESIPTTTQTSTSTSITTTDTDESSFPPGSSSVLPLGNNRNTTLGKQNYIDISKRTKLNSERYSPVANAARPASSPVQRSNISEGIFLENLSQVLPAGSGAYSNVFSPPPVLCNGSNKFDKGYVGKLFPTMSEAVSEFALSSVIKEIDPLSVYTITPVKLCKIVQDQAKKKILQEKIQSIQKKAKENYVMQIIYPYAGKSYANQPIQLPFVEYMKPIILLSCMISFMNQNFGFFHLDIQPGNVLFHRDTQQSDEASIGTDRLTLIDFGLSGGDMEKLYGIIVNEILGAFYLHDLKDFVIFYQNSPEFIYFYNMLNYALRIFDEGVKKRNRNNIGQEYADFVQYVNGVNFLTKYNLFFADAYERKIRGILGNDFFRLINQKTIDPTLSDEILHIVVEILKRLQLRPSQDPRQSYDVELPSRVTQESFSLFHRVFEPFLAAQDAWGTGLLFSWYFEQKKETYGKDSGFADIYIAIGRILLVMNPKNRKTTFDFAAESAAILGQPFQSSFKKYITDIQRRVYPDPSRGNVGIAVQDELEYLKSIIAGL